MGIFKKYTEHDERQPDVRGAEAVMSAIYRQVKSDILEEMAETDGKRQNLEELAAKIRQDEQKLREDRQAFANDREVIRAEILRDISAQNEVVFDEMREKLKDQYHREFMHKVRQLSLNEGQLKLAAQNLAFRLLEAILPNGNWRSLRVLGIENFDLYEVNRCLGLFGKRIEHRNIEGAEMFTLIKTDADSAKVSRATTFRIYDIEPTPTNYPVSEEQARIDQRFTQYANDSIWKGK
jgi:hypothetical protein